MAEQKTHTSFIPKKSLTVASRPRKSRGSSIGILFLLTLIIFIGAITLAVGVFLYQQFLLKSVEQKSASLERARAAFEPSLIMEIGRLNTRIDSAQDILNNHKAVSTFFELLEASTLQSVSFENLNYIINEGGGISISMRGRSASFNSVALQSDIFGKNKFIQEPIFSNLNLDNRGGVVFNLTAFIDPHLISYENAILSQ